MSWLIGIGAAALAHFAPFPFLFDSTDRTLWRMPATNPPTIFLTFDDGPNMASDGRPSAGKRDRSGTSTCSARGLRMRSRASPGDIIVIRDGDDDDPRADRRYAVETIDRVIPEMKAARVPVRDHLPVGMSEETMRVRVVIVSGS